MSPTKYFILSKTNNPFDTIEDDQTVILNSKHIFILPKIFMDTYIFRGIFECDLIEWSKQLCSKDKVFLDIGAHTGTYSIALSSYNQHVYSFEPQKMSYYAMCGSVVLSNIQNVTCYQIGLGSQEQVGEQTLKIVSEDGGGSTLHATSGVLREETIQIKTLDSFNIKNIGFIKMDVEENELYVLQGAVETLRNSNYPTIIYECNPNTELENKIYTFLTQTLCYRVRPLGQHPTNMYIAEK